MLALACTGPALAAAASVTVRMQTYVPRVRAFARVQSITDASVRAGLDGRLLHLDVVPGAHVRAGQRIGDVGGSLVRSRLAQDRAQLEASRSAEHSLGDTLSIQRQRLTQGLSTRDDVARAARALDRARTARIKARQTLDADRGLARLQAPASGTVVSVHAHVGERVRAGQALALIQPGDALWLMAAAYDPHARARLHVGMHGRFQPDDGSRPMAIRIAQLPPRLRADGGQPIAMVRAPSDSGQAWVNGETGTVSLVGRAVQRLLVPTRALVLDRGVWWVLLDTPHGDRKQPVTPGARVGDRTVIVQGLKRGEKVIVEHVYRRFHRGVRRRYQIQD